MFLRDSSYLCRAERHKESETGESVFDYLRLDIRPKKPARSHSLAGFSFYTKIANR